MSGLDKLLRRISTVFDRSEVVATGADDFPSLSAARNAPLKPGLRDHDNDKECYRDITIVPTALELESTQKPYLPMPDGSEYLTDGEAKVTSPPLAPTRTPPPSPSRH